MMEKKALSIAIALVILTMIGAVVAATLDIPGQFDTDAQPGDPVGWEVVINGSGTSVPLPPVIGLVLGSLLALGAGWRRTTGLILLFLTGLIIVIASVGEFVSGNPFSGVRLILFYGFSGAHGLLAAVLLVTSLAALFQQRRTGAPSPAPKS
jgi:hypothetical protein